MKDGLLHQIWKIREADRIWTGGMGAMLLLLLLFLEAAVHWRDSMILWAVLYGAMNLLVCRMLCIIAACEERFVCAWRYDGRIDKRA